MTAEANEIFQWIGVGIALLICLTYVVKKVLKKKPESNLDKTGCEGCPLLKDCSRKSCDTKKPSSNSCCS